MKIEKIQNKLYAVTEVSDIFISDYLPGLPPPAVKMYLYLLYASEKEVSCEEATLAMILNSDISVIRENLIILESIGLITCHEEIIMINDLVQKEIEKNYRPRMAARPEESLNNPLDKNYERAQIQKAISDKFFAGQMPAHWYNEIDLWFEKYGFEPDVVFLLFQQCYKQHVMTKPYIRKVAENWGDKHKIKTQEQLERYLNLYDEYNKLKNEITKKLRLRRNMTAYEEEIVEKWFYTYEYRMDIIEIALKKSVSKANATLSIFDNIITSWYKNGFKTVEEVLQFEEERLKLYKENKKTENNNQGNKAEIKQKNNYTQREYDDEFLNSLFVELTDKKDEES